MTLTPEDLRQMRLYDSGATFERRTFLRLLGGGIVVAVTVGDSSALARLAPQGGRGYPTDVNAYVHVREDGRVSVFSGKIEMGQGAMTSLAQMAADELGVPLHAIDMVMGDTDLCPWDMGTWGSLTTRFFGPALRAGAARAREILVGLAADKLGVPAERLKAEGGEVFDTTTPENRATYAELTRGRRIDDSLGADAVLRAAEDLEVSGSSPIRLDAREKVTGAAKFAADVRLPGMLYAKILRPPAHGAVLESVDTSEAERIPGVRLVRQDDLVAVLHEDPETAAAALDVVKATFDVPEPNVDNDNIFDHLVATAPRPQEHDARGDLSVGEAKAVSVFDETYVNQYVAHAPMEPHAAVAGLEDDRVTVWASTQAPFMVKGQVAGALGIDATRVRVRTPYVGGGFGGKAANQQAIEAARLAQATGSPVQVAWTRAEEFFYDTFRPAAVVKVRSGIDKDGKICLWDYAVYFGGSRGSDQLFDVPHNSIRAYGEWMGGGTGAHPFAVGAWRAPGANTNVFAKALQVDAMAAAAGMDPLEFRMANTSDSRLRSVLEAAAERFEWTPATVPSGRGQGIATGIDAGSYVALMAEVEVDEISGAISVRRVVCAQDMGFVVSPVGATMQMEGCITMGLGYALSEQVRFRGGEILDRNFDTYELPRMSWMPEIETVLVENDALSPQGGGEPAIIGMGGVIANAVFDATGARVRHLPMTPKHVRAAIAAARS